MARLPDVAPHDSCIACLKGDTTTGLALVGSVEFRAAGLVAMGVPTAEAIATVEESPRFDPDIAAAYPDDTSPFLVCAECAAKAKMRVAPLADGIPMYGESVPT